MGIWDWLFDKPKTEASNIENKVGNNSVVYDMKNNARITIEYLLLDKVFNVDISESEFYRVSKNPNEIGEMVCNKIDLLLEKVKEEFDNLEIINEIYDFPIIIHNNSYSTEQYLSDSVLEKDIVSEFCNKLNSVEYCLLKSEKITLNNITFKKDRRYPYRHSVYTTETALLRPYFFKGFIINNLEKNKVEALKMNEDKIHKNNLKCFFTQLRENLQYNAKFIENILNKKAEEEYSGYKVKIEDDDLDNFNIEIFKEVGDDFYEFSHSRLINKKSLAIKFINGEPLDNLFFNIKNGILTK